MSSARKYFLDLAENMRRAPYKFFLWPNEAGELDWLHNIQRNHKKSWSILPRVFRQVWYEYNFRYNRRQRFKAIESDDFKDFGPPPFKRPAPDAPAVTS